MNCPRCQTPLQVQNADRLVMNCCYQCGGLFLDGASSKRVVDAVDPNAVAAANQVSQYARANVATDAIAPCPMCNKALDKMPIPNANVTVDVCREHGVWFDRDELQRVVQAVGQQPVPAPQQALPPGMAAGQYVAPGWLDPNAAKPFGGMPQMGTPTGEQAGGWGVGKTALAVGGGLAAVAGVAYVASNTDLGRQVLGTNQAGFGAIGGVLSKLF